MTVSLEDIAYHKSSSKTKPNKIMREKVLPFFLEHDIRTVLDYGCGKFLRDSLFLAGHGMIVDAVDVEEQVKRVDLDKARKVNSLASRIVGWDYDASLLNFVLQVLPTEGQREGVLKDVYDALKPGGFFVMSLRNMRDIRHCVEERGFPFNDGFLMGKSGEYTFVRGYEVEEMEGILISLNLEIIEIYKTCDSFIALSRK